MFLRYHELDVCFTPERESLRTSPFPSPVSLVFLYLSLFLYPGKTIPRQKEPSIPGFVLLFLGVLTPNLA